MSGILLIVRRSLRQHALSTAVTAASIALACGLVTAVLAIDAQSYKAFTGGSGGYDAVLGARGSELQLVMNAVYHLEVSKANLPWDEYEVIAADPRVAEAVPFALGDSYRGFRIVGTTGALFESFRDGDGQPMRFQPPGRAFDPELAEAVVGSTVAQRTGLAYGSHFNPTHGLSAASAHEHEEEYVVVGVLEPTNTPADRVVWIPIEGVFRMGGHLLRGAGEEFEAHAHEEIPEEHLEVSAVLLKLKSSEMGDSLYREINREGTTATLAWPIARVMAELFEKIGWMSRVLSLVAVMVVIVAVGSITASLYNTMNERRREFAILRALGARRSTVLSAIVLESAAIAAIGSLCGYLVYGAILSAAAATLRAETGVALDPFELHPALFLAPAGLVALGALAGLVPAIKAYRTDVATNLAPSS